MRRFTAVLVGVAAVLVGMSQTVAAPVQWPVSSGGNDHWYEPVYVGSNTLWTYARDVALAKGGCLATLTSTAENAFVTNLISSDPKYWDVNSSGTFGPWVGGYQYDKLSEPSGHWRWTTGEAWSYTNWSSGEPNNAYNREDCVQLGRSASGQWGVWNDQMNSAEWCKVPGFIVEYDSLPQTNVLTMSFQQGVNGYTGTSDTMVRLAVPNQTYQTAASLLVLNSRGNDSQGLLRFDNLIGSGANQVPAGATIVSAMLQWRTSDTANNACELHRILVPWSDATATWNTMTNGIQTDGVEAVAAADTALTPSGTSAAPLTTCDVTSSVQAWANGAANNGWAMLSTGSDSWGFSSAEGALAPVLTVSYTVPEPASLVLLSIGAIGLLAYAQRQRNFCAGEDGDITDCGEVDNRS